jgi:hypothetical protein
MTMGIKELRKAWREQVRQAAAMFKPNTVYFLKGVQ